MTPVAYCGFWYQVREEPRLTEQQFGEIIQMCASSYMHIVVEKATPY